MRALLSTVAVIAVALALSGCHDRQQQPLPGPKSPTPTTSARRTNSGPHAPAAAAPGSTQERDSPDEINWFQGTLEEAFSRRPRTDDRPLFR
jgi:hypothetical protein